MVFGADRDDVDPRVRSRPIIAPVRADWVIEFARSTVSTTTRRCPRSARWSANPVPPPCSSQYTLLTASSTSGRPATTVGMRRANGRTSSTGRAPLQTMSPSTRSDTRVSSARRSSSTENEPAPVAVTTRYPLADARSWKAVSRCP